MAIIEKLHVLNFRNLADQYLLPNNNINLILGQNGQGKTNFIESIYYLGHGRSFKTKNFRDVVPFDDQQIKISAVVDSQKVYAKKVMAYLLLNQPDYGMAYRHHFGEPAKAI